MECLFSVKRVMLHLILNYRCKLCAYLVRTETRRYARARSRIPATAGRPRGAPNCTCPLVNVQMGPIRLRGGQHMTHDLRNLRRFYIFPLVIKLTVDKSISFKTDAKMKPDLQLISICRYSQE